MHIRKPRLRITKKGLKLTKPSVRLGGKSGINISGRGVSASVRTKAGSYNTKRGCSIPFFGSILLILAVALFGCSGSSTEETRAIVVNTLPADTATLDPTDTEEPPTNTPAPTDTLEPTETPLPSSTPEPTETSEPTQTSTITTTLAATEIPTQTPIPTNTPRPTEIPVLTTGEITIDTIHFDGTGNNEPDEYVVITNRSTSPIRLQGWTLSDKADHVYYFPSYTIQPGASCRIYTNESHPEYCDFSYRFDSSAIWNNGGDTATLKDSTGAVISTYQY